MAGNSFSIIIMGVCGCGKSTVGHQLAESMDIPFLDGDDFHSDDNKVRMASGSGLTDDERMPWLEKLGELLASRGQVVLACSALRRQYRDVLRKTSGKSLIFIHLNIERKVLEQRLMVREGHFVGPDLLDSQLATLEVPDEDELHVVVGPEPDMQRLVEEIWSIAAM
ncbi:MAG: gluconokinase [Methyloligellaceae bacterium]